MTLILRDLTIYKNQNEVLISDLNMEVKAGEVLCIMGPSGCGKSTLLDAIAGHLNEFFSYTGEIILAQQNLKNIAVYQRQVGILFQDDLLFPHLRVWENLAFALPNETKGARRKALAFEALKDINLSQLASAFPEQLSGGQRARISLIRMLLAKPKLALLDEPFNKLDKALRSQFRDWVFNQIKKAHIPALMVTHDLEDVPEESQLYQLSEAGEGKKNVR